MVLARTYRLGSNDMVHAPGVLKWAITGYKTKKDRKKMIDVMRSWPTEISHEEWHMILTGQIPHKVENDAVVITL